MNTSLLFQLKGYLMLGLGVVLTLFPAQFFALLDASIANPGSLFVRLFGLLCFGMGFSLAFDKAAGLPPRSMALNYALCDAVAVALLIGAGMTGTINALAYLLALVYIGSGLLYTHCFRLQR